MKLTGQELRILPGVVTIYLHVPLHFGTIRTLSDEDEAALAELRERLTSSRENAYDQAHTEEGADRAEIIRNRLSVTAETSLSPRERVLLVEALDACAVEMEHGGDVNIHFNGDEYGVRPEHLRTLKRRLEQANE